MYKGKDTASLNECKTNKKIYKNKKGKRCPLLKTKELPN